MVELSFKSVNRNLQPDTDPSFQNVEKLVGTIDDITTRSLMNSFFGVVIQRLNYMDYILRFQAGSFTGLLPPTIDTKGRLTYIISINVDEVEIPFYPYAVISPDIKKIDLYAVRYPIAMVIIHELNHLYDAFMNDDKILNGIDITRLTKKEIGSINEQIRVNFDNYNKRTFYNRFATFAYKLQTEIDDLMSQTSIPYVNLVHDKPQIPKVPEDATDFVNTFLPETYIDNYVQPYIQSFIGYVNNEVNLNGSQLNELYESIAELNIGRAKIFEDFFDSINSTNVKATATIMRKVIEIKMAYYTVYKSWNTTNYDDLLVILHKEINGIVYNESAFFINYCLNNIDELEQVPICPLLDLEPDPGMPGRYRIPLDLLGNQSVYLAEFFNENNIVVRYGHQSEGQTIDDFSTPDDRIKHISFVKTLKEFAPYFISLNTLVYIGMERNAPICNPLSFLLF